jgi:hypothetical protein
MKKETNTLTVEGVQKAHRYMNLMGYCITKKKFLDLWWEVYQKEITIP